MSVSRLNVKKISDSELPIGSLPLIVDEKVMRDSALRIIIIDDQNAYFTISNMGFNHFSFERGSVNPEPVFETIENCVGN